MHDPQTMKRINEEWEARALDKPPAISFDHFEVLRMLSYLTIVENPDSTLSSAIKKLETIRALQLRANERNRERKEFAERDRWRSE